MLNPIWIETAPKKKGISFHRFTQKYHETYDQPPDMEFDDEYEQKFHEFEKERWKHSQAEGIPWKPVLIEKQIEDDFFTSIVDRLDDNDDGSYTLVEYKKKQYKTKDIPQMSFSIILLAKNGIGVTKNAIYYTEGPMYYKDPSKNSLNSILRKMSLVRSSMKAGLFPAKPGWHCKNCVYVNEGCDFQGIKELVCGGCRSK